MHLYRAMHNILRSSHLGDFRTSNGEHIWVKRENLVAEAKAAQGSPRASNAPSADVWSPLIRLRNTQNGFLLSIHS
jgi:hypothetical protein